MASRQVAVIVVSLCGTEPRIWRRFRVPVAIRLDRLHWAIQAVMGWEGVHEYEFEIAGRRYVVELNPDAGNDAPVTAVRRATVAKVGPRLGVPFRYRYDMGDYWEHDVVLEALDWEDSETFVCTDGAMACPPEDSGGAAAYTAVVRKRQQTGNGKHHPEARAASGALDNDFDPETFSPSIATHTLRLLASAGVLGEYA